MGLRKHASGIKVCLGGKITGTDFVCFNRKQETLRMKWETRGQKLHKEQQEEEMRNRARYVAFDSRLFGQQSGSTERSGREGGSDVRQDLLFTPFFPLRSFLYCSLSLVIRPGSTSQASDMGPCSSFSTQGEQNQTKRLLKNYPGWGQIGLAGWVNVQ